MDEDLRDSHYLTGLVDGMLLAQRITFEGLDGRAQLQAVIERLSAAKVSMIYDMYVGPSDALRDKLLELSEMSR